MELLIGLFTDINTTRHLDAYSNPNFTTWAEAGYKFPKNRLVDDC